MAAIRYNRRRCSLNYLWVRFCSVLIFVVLLHILFLRANHPGAVQDDGAFPQPKPKSNSPILGLPAKVRTKQDRKPTVAFITYELFPVTTWGGGAGVVINSLIKDLLQNGHDVVVLADFGSEYLQSWDEYRRKTQFTGTLYVRHVASVLGEVTIQQSASIFMYKSRSFAMALKLVYQEIPFDIVECFDYAGVAYELLRSKQLGVEDYLPSSVLIAIRFHGTLQLIDRAENNEVPITNIEERTMMYLKEQFSIYSADLLFCQTHFMIPRLAAEYSVSNEEIFYAPAPLESILETVDEADEQVLAPPAWKKSFDFLVYGRFQLVKGLENIVLAGVSLLRSSVQTTAPIRFLFVGPDTYSKEHNQLSSEYLSSLIPVDLRANFVFKPTPINRTELVTLSRQVRAAVFASQFETLNLAVHELARLKVPLILSDISAFQEYFSNSPQAVFFKSGNFESLRDAIKVVVAAKFEPIIDTIRSGDVRLQYADATSVYRLYDLPATRRRTRLLALEMDKQIRRYDAEINA